MVQPSRYQMNQGVKTALVRHFADLSMLDFSCTGATVYLSGTLKKDPQGEFPKTELEAMLREIVRVPGVRSLQANLENWAITYSGSGFELYRKTRPQGSSGSGEAVRIDETETVQDVLETIVDEHGKGSAS